MIRTILFLSFLIIPSFGFSQMEGPVTTPWHGFQRAIRYSPEGTDFVIKNGNRRFNRALYGTNTGFRVEAGDLPEFALYMPRMGGNLKFGLITATESKWMIDCEEILARYRPGTMLYEVKDKILGDGVLKIKVLPMSDADGVIVLVEGQDLPESIELFWAFGGATGKRFNRDGDIGADPESSFYLKPEYCNGNIFTINKNQFHLKYDEKQKELIGTFPEKAKLKIADATQQVRPQQSFESTGSATPFLVSKIALQNQPALYFSIHNPTGKGPLQYSALAEQFDQAEQARVKLANRIQLQTPDPYITPFGGALAVAADAVYEHPTFLHGAIAWRMRLNGWRGAYAADPLGWHDRARAHFDAYALSQLTEPIEAPLVPDTSRHFARQEETLGTALFSSGYICRNPGGEFRAHHYDMNQVFIDQLLRHFDWTGDLEYAKSIWPVLERHLAWEKRCFDQDEDGLYDAYCSIWASDALQYSGGGVTHASAYNYFANKKAAELAALIGQDEKPYREQASKILKSINSNLWMPDLGSYAEYKELLHKQALHPNAGLWTIYHAIDSEISDPFQAYQALRYVDTNIPHIPIKAEGVPDGFYTLSTTSWMPYTWSVNNVALAEVLHIALANWQAGRKAEAFHLWKSVIMESMYLGASPGYFQQLSFYDAIRGELYRDFADPIGMATRTLVEGLFGIKPDVLSKKLVIQPGLPDEWNEAKLELPDVQFQFERSGNTDRYIIDQSLPETLSLTFQTKAISTEVESIEVNGKTVKWQTDDSSIGYPVLRISAPPASHYEIEISWGSVKFEVPSFPKIVAQNSSLELNLEESQLLEVYDPQQAVATTKSAGQSFLATVNGLPGYHTVFIKIRQGLFSWWHPIDFEIRPSLEVLFEKRQAANQISFQIQNNEDFVQNVTLFENIISIEPHQISETVMLDGKDLLPGTNSFVLKTQAKKEMYVSVVNWDVKCPKETDFETIDLTLQFNSKVTDIFQQKYLSPRPSSPTVQIPWQGIGNWCYPWIEANIDDSGLRKLVSQDGTFKTPEGIPFSSPWAKEAENIVFTSLWDNYPESASIALSGNASHAYFLLAGSTNHMQSRFDNGVIIITYEDGSTDELILRNPESWWPIEQDYFFDGYAFASDAPIPTRVHLKTGLITRNFDNYTSIKGYSDRVIDGGAATVLDLPLNPDKKLKNLTLKTLASEVVIGLMAVTLVR